jgi:hypothetical protein
MAAILTLVLLCGLVTPVYAADKAALDASVNAAAAFMLTTVKKPQVGSVGGEWAILGLARSGYKVPDAYYEGYYKAVEKYVGEYKGVLHDRKYTEYSRVILGLTAAGYDPRDVAGYDLTLPLGDYDKTIWQGINGPVFALIALDSLDYPIPTNKDAKNQATREMYIADILRRQTADGGWNLTAGSGGANVDAKEKGDADLTGMALQALAKYQDKPLVRAAIQEALAFLSAKQDAKGGFSSSFSGGSSAVESAVQVLVALCELGIPVDDPRFVKGGYTLVDNILRYKNTDGSFKHTLDGETSYVGNSQMSTEQAFYGLVAAQRAASGKDSLYRMGDAAKRGTSAPAAPAGTAGSGGLPGKHADIHKAAVSSPGKAFADVQGHINQKAVEALSARGLIGGRTDTAFVPGATMTRAEFAVLTTRVLGLPGKTGSTFTDIPSGAWYTGGVATAYYYELVGGVSATQFHPEGTITRQEAAAMVARAAKLCGMDITRTDVEIRDTLAPFGDYREAADWAAGTLAFCYSAGILDGSAMNIEPTRAITRGEVAEMLYRLLDKANLL